MHTLLESTNRDIPIENTPNIIDPHIEKGDTIERISIPI